LCQFPTGSSAVLLHLLRVGWLALYLLLPITVATLLALAAKLDPLKRGHVLDFLVLFSLGLAVDLRWFEPAWPHALTALNKLLLLDARLYGFHAIRKLDGVGFDLPWPLTDWKRGHWSPRSRAANARTTHLLPRYARLAPAFPFFRLFNRNEIYVDA
jgi:hypothetical protein